MTENQTNAMTDLISKSGAIYPIVEAPYPKAALIFNDVFGFPQKVDENWQPVDESKWRDYSIHITPQKRFETACEKSLIADKARLTVSAARANQDSSTYTTIDTRVVFQVKELIYPGDEVINVEEKWIYAIHVNAAKVLAEVFTVSPTKWLFRYNPTFPSNSSVPLPNNECDGKLELPMISASETGSNIGFLISPFRLTSQAVEFLLEDTERLKSVCVCAVRESTEQYFAAAPDAYQWAVDAHEKYYIPLLNEWQEYIFDPKLQAKLFIAGTLKAWIEAPDKGIVYDSKDPLDVEDELKSRDSLYQSGEPYRFLNKYENEEESLRIKAEKAAAYLYHCVYSPEHRALEKAALEAKDLSLTLTFQNWAVVCDRACETAQGRMFIERAYKDVSRLPQQYLFSDQSLPPLPERLGMNFPNLRYAWLAAIAITGDIMPAVFKTIIDKNVLEQRQIPEKTIKYLENLGLKIPSAALKKPSPQLRLFYQQLRKKENSSAVFESLESLLKKIETFGDDDILKNIGERSLDDLIKGINESLIYKNRFKIGVVFEWINVLLAISEFSSSNGWNNDKFVSLVGASADFSSVIAEAAFREIGLEKAGKIAVGKGVGGFAGIIGGICQMLDEQRQMVEGISQYDYGVVTGHHIAAAGAGMTAIGGGFVLAEAIGYGSVLGGPFGAAIGAIGAGLIIGGNLLAAWLKDNQHEQFARFCFLGKQYDTAANQILSPYQKSVVYPEWSAEGGIPTDDILKEARLLIWLLSSFQIECNDKNPPKLDNWEPLRKYRGSDPSKGRNGNPDVFVKITPGYLPPNAKITIKLEQTYRNSSQNNFGVYSLLNLEATLTVDLENEKIIQTSGNMFLDAKHSAFETDKFKNVLGINFAIRPERVTDSLNGKVISSDAYFNDFEYYRFCESSLVKVQITIGRVYQPNASKFVVFDTLKDRKISSIDTSKWQ